MKRANAAWVGLVASLGLVLPAAPAMAQSTIDCSSDNYRRDFCAVDTRGGVRLERDYTRDSLCRQGESWGTTDEGGNRGIWVDRGCRGRFRVGDNGGGSRKDNTAAVVGGLILGGLILGALSHHSDRDRDRDDGRRPDRDPQPGYGGDPSRGAIDNCANEAIAQGASYGGRARVDRITDQYPSGRSYHVEGYVKVEPSQSSPLMFNFYCEWDGYRARVRLN
jgi:hypothetical protein